MGTLSLAQLRLRLEGVRQQVKARPEVWVTVEQLGLNQSGVLTGSIRIFSPVEFEVQDLPVDVLVEVGSSKEAGMFVAAATVLGAAGGAMLARCGAAGGAALGAAAAGL